MAVSSIESTLLETSLSDLTLLSRGKVRDVYSTSDPSALLFIATDRISAYDVVLNNVRLLYFSQILSRRLTARHFVLLNLGDSFERPNSHYAISILV